MREMLCNCVDKLHVVGYTFIFLIINTFSCFNFVSNQNGRYMTTFIKTVFYSRNNSSRTGVINSFKRAIPVIALALTFSLLSGCRKDKSSVDDNPSYYGYGKLTVDCEKKCHVSYGVAGKMNDYDVESGRAVYFFRYQTKYNIDINITPTDAEQTMGLNVYSREEKQIFSNTVRRKVNETWNSKILVP